MAGSKSKPVSNAPVKEFAGAINYYLLQGKEDKRFRLLIKIDRQYNVWSLAKEPSSDPNIKRLAIIEEETGKPDKINNTILDKGNFIAVNQESEPIEKKQAIHNLKNGELKIMLNGKKLQGGYVLVQAKTYGNSRWLFIKHKDQYATVKT